MSGPWYTVADPRPDAAWELYHENSKRGPHDGIQTPGSVPTTPDYSGFPAVPLAPRPPSTAAPPPPAAHSGPVSLRAFSDLLAAVERPVAESDPISAYVAIEAIETLPPGLAWYDGAGHRLHLLRSDGVWRQLEQALPSPDVLRRSAALILLAADLGAATAAAGERGYRDVLIDAGRRLAALETAAAAAALRLETAGFYDREIDALLYLDGLAQSIVAVVAVGG